MATAGAPPRVEEDTGPAVGDDGSGPAARPADKLASQVASRIEAEVIALGWPVGQALDSEPVLRERYGISRTLLREAVRLVEHHQVARMRRGPGGGLIVCAPDVGPATRAAVTYLEFSGTNPVDVMRARTLIEPTASRLCSERITEDGIAALRGALKAEIERDSDPRTWAENPLHVIMCKLAGNPTFDLFVDILNQLSLRYVATWAPEPANLRPAMASTHRWHGEIVSAVIAGDASRAEIRVAEHFAEMTTWLEAGQRESGTIAPASAFAFRDGEWPRVKPAEVVAARIYDDIVAQGRKIGSLLGSERELIGRYDTSRAVLRAAVRLLEHHSIARARRGTGGGLVITRPQPDACVDAAALYLAFRGASPRTSATSGRRSSSASWRTLRPAGRSQVSPAGSSSSRTGWARARRPAAARLARDFMLSWPSWAPTKFFACSCRSSVISPSGSARRAGWPPRRAPPRMRPATSTGASWTRSGTVTRPSPSTGCGGI